MPTLAVGMIDFREIHGMATQVWPWHPQSFYFPQQKLIMRDDAATWGTEERNQLRIQFCVPLQAVSAGGFFSFFAAFEKNKSKSVKHMALRKCGCILRLWVIFFKIPANALDAECRLVYLSAPFQMIHENLSSTLSFYLI
jgi:hypothetical protein